MRNGPFGAGSQLASLSLPGDSFWMSKRHPAIGIALELRQHRRVDQIAIDRIGDEQARRQFIHRQRPERVDRRQLARREAQQCSGWHRPASVSCHRRHRIGYIASSFELP